MLSLDGMFDNYINLSVIHIQFYAHDAVGLVSAWLINVTVLSITIVGDVLIRTIIFHHYYDAGYTVLFQPATNKSCFLQKIAF